ncbi:MAG: SCO family protein [Caulobacteraceae bacterium]|nr:SCO family protein [Caulobacteraceae bacterium]
MTRKFAPWILVAVAALVFAGLAAWRFAGPGGRAPAASSSPAVGGPFQLADQNGRPVDQRVLRGKWSAVFFGYTFCPDVCPTTLQTLGAASEELGARGKDFQVVFVTVDPERDTPAKLKDYLSSAAFPRGTIGLTGSPQQIAAITKAYGVFYEKDGSGPAYAVSHSSAIYLMNPKGQYDSVIAYGLTPDQTRDQILKAMRQGGAS